jgi:hypothetical protein
LAGKDGNGSFDAPFCAILRRRTANLLGGLNQSYPWSCFALPPSLERPGWRDRLSAGEPLHPTLNHLKAFLFAALTLRQ